MGQKTPTNPFKLMTTSVQKREGKGDSLSRSLYGSQLPLVRDRGAYSCRYFPLSSPLTEPHKSVCSCNCCVYGPSLPRPAILASTNKNIIDELMFKIEET